MLKAIIFDFDGVICESVDAKAEAFRRLFESYPEHLSQIMDYHMRNGGISRYVKFQVIYRDMLKKELTEAESKRLGQEFSKHCYQMVVDAPLVKGAQAFLDGYLGKVKFFVASGTPQEEMISIVKAKRLEKYFAGVFGSPTSKHGIALHILKAHQLAAADAIFVGDSINDYDGAKKAGIQFVGRVRAGDPDPFKGTDTATVVENIDDFAQWLNSRKLLSA